MGLAVEMARRWWAAARSGTESVNATRRRPKQTKGSVRASASKLPADARYHRPCEPSGTPTTTSAPAAEDALSPIGPSTAFISRSSFESNASCLHIQPESPRCTMFVDRVYHIHATATVQRLAPAREGLKAAPKQSPATQPSPPCLFLRPMPNPGGSCSHPFSVLSGLPRSLSASDQGQRCRVPRSRLRSHKAIRRTLYVSLVRRPLSFELPRGKMTILHTVFHAILHRKRHLPDSRCKNVQ